MNLKLYEKPENALLLHSELCAKYFLPNIKLIFWENMGDIEGEQGEADSDTLHTFTPVENRIIFEAPNG